MTKENNKKLLCDESLRHSEYYEMQDVFDGLYARSKNGEELQLLGKCDSEKLFREHEYGNHQGSTVRVIRGKAKPFHAVAECHNA